jgi:hypothetical protein
MLVELSNIFKTLDLVPTKIKKKKGQPTPAIKTISLTMMLSNSTKVLSATLNVPPNAIMTTVYGGKNRIDF